MSAAGNPFPVDQAPRVIDVDIHPMLKTDDALDPYLPRKWRDYAREYGQALRQPYIGGTAYPKVAPAISRRDSWPPNGGPPGSDLAFMREQYLDPVNIEYGILQILYPNTRDERNQGFAEALCRAVNDWQLAEWSEPEPRLKASIVVPTNNPQAAAAEINARAGNEAYASIFLTPKTSEPIASTYYWPIFEAAVANDMPIGMHSGGVNGLAPTASGWPSYYLEEHTCSSMAMQAAISNMILGGLFDEFPALRLVMTEAGFGGIPALAWRLDKIWERCRGELPNVSMPPSAYLRRNFWFATQPVEEPERNEDLLDVFEWVGWDRILFSSDYPHWDFDDPRFAFKIPMTPEQRQAILFENAHAVYRLK